MRLLIRLVVLALSAVVIAVGVLIGALWYDGSRMMGRAQSAGWLSPVPDDTPMTTLENTVARAIFGDSWDAHGFPCRTASSFWGHYTGGKTHKGMSVSLIIARDISYEVEASQSLRSQMRQLALACALEGKFTDAKLLRLWLRRASFGNGLVGPTTAAQAVFGKSPDALDAQESARLAVLLSWPSTWSDRAQWDARAQTMIARAAAN